MKCSVEGCKAEAKFRVILYDFYPHPGDARVFYETDLTCPALCSEHAIENEKGAIGERKPRGVVTYPHSNGEAAQGFTIYQPIDWPSPPKE